MKKKLMFISTLFAISLIGCSENNNDFNNAPGRNNNPFENNVVTPSDGKVKGISLNYETASLKLGKTLTLVATVDPYDAENQEVSWESNNTDVATVSSNGTVTSVATGTATITVTTSEGGYSASCVISVIEESNEDTYVPDVTSNDIYIITEDTLSNGEYDSEKEEYSFAVSGNYKQIYVNAPEKTIVLELNGVTIQNNENSPIYVASCDEIEISAKKNTTNYIKDLRGTYTEDIDGQGKGAIYVVDGDLKLKGTGTLDITGNYYNGIHCKDDVKVQKQTLNITAVHHGIKGNDSITIVSGNINISCGGDGLHTENTDISDKGNQRGNVTISGGTVNINSWGDAVAASYNAIVEEADETVPTSFVAKTNKYSSYSGTTVETSESYFYLKMNSSAYNNGGYTYAAYINGSWYKATYKGTQSTGGMGGPGGGGRPGGGGSSTYYIYQIEKPSSAQSFTLYRFLGNSVTEFSRSTYNAVSDLKAFNSAYDMVQISVTNKTINFSSWSNYASGNNNGADISAKGLKAENEVYVTGGTVDIKAYDDAIHANNDASLENGTTPLGNINISGGNLTLAASDDAVHADYTLNITGGRTEVTTAYEGLEANLIKVSGGETFVYATDDGVNATSGKSSPSVIVSGGLLDVCVPTSGDTDGIDSNGTFVQTGGTVIVKGPGSASGTGSPAAAMDTDGAISLSGGSLIVFGGLERTPSSSLTKTLCSSSSVSAGSHTISFASSNTSYTTTLKYATNGCVVYSSLGSATLK